MTAPASAAPRDITRAEFAGVAELLYAESGITLKPGKEPMVMGRLEKRLRALGLTTYTAYLEELRRPGAEAELRTAVDLLTTNETYFFREPQHFAFLADVVVPARPYGRPLRVWSAASSSGEEAYSAAMVLEDRMTSPWEIVGTDLSTRMVERCRQGLYPLAAAEKIPTPLLKRFCLRGTGAYEGQLVVTRALRDRVSFRCANLLEDLSPLGMFDVIFLRNVMIYFDTDTKAALVARAERMLHPGGHLLVSHSETLNGLGSGLQMVRPSVYRRPA